MHALTERLGTIWERALIVLGIAALAFAMVVATPALAADETPDRPATDQPSTDDPTDDEPGSDQPGTDEPGSDQPGDEPQLDVEWYKSVLTDQMAQYIRTFGISNDAGLYKAEDFEAYMTALDAAATVVDDDEATITEVVDAASDLFQAVIPLMNSLTVTESQAYLATTIESIEAFLPGLETEGGAEPLNIAGFTADTWTPFVSAYNEAKSVNALEDAELEDVVTAQMNLMTAYDAILDPETQPASAQLYALVRTVDLGIITDEALDVYTTESYEAVLAAYEAADDLYTDAVPADPDAEQYATAMEDLNTALANLQLKPEYEASLPVRTVIWSLYSAIANEITDPMYEGADVDSLVNLNDKIADAIEGATDLQTSAGTLRTRAHELVDALFAVEFPGEDPMPLWTSLNFVYNVASRMGDVNPGASDEVWETFQYVLIEAKQVIDAAEPDSIEASESIFAIYQSLNALVGQYESEPVFRLFNPFDGGHLFTTDTNEIAALFGDGWLVEDIAWWAPTDPLGQNLTVTRLYNPYSHDHYYVLNDEKGIGEVEALKTAGWTVDTDSAFLSPVNSPVQVYQLWNPYRTADTHLWTTDSNEYQDLQGLGWRGEGVVWFGVPVDFAE